ncbi:hypothetical protein A4R28_11455 [Mesorhizobium ciceri]|nr:hypothetical protein A4R28_11455 [Mesorhizobium ciceri]
MTQPSRYQVRRAKRASARRWTVIRERALVAVLCMMLAPPCAFILYAIVQGAVICQTEGRCL